MVERLCLINLISICEMMDIEENVLNAIKIPIV